VTPLRALVRAELLKLRGVRTPWLLLAAAQAVILVGITGLMLGDPDVTARVTTVAALAHVGLTSLFALVLGVLSTAGEYRRGTVVDTFLGTPRRGRVLLVKVAVTSVAATLAGIVGAVVALGATASWLSGKGGSLDLGDGAVWRTLAGGIGWNAAFAAIGAGLGAVTRSVVGALVGTLSWIALVEGLVGSVLGDAARWLPFRAGSALGALPDAAGGPALEQPMAGVVLLGYAAAFALVGVLGTVRRDVT
jgi:ABC-2 type transport system permease protein